MFNLTRYVKLGSVVRNYGATKMLFASATVHVEKKDPADTLNRPAAKKAKNPTIAAVFQSLSEEDEGSLANITRHLSKKPDVDEIIMNAKTVNGLLKIVETYPDLDRTHALKIVSILAEWTTISRAELREFENDKRFTKLCRQLGKAVPKDAALTNRSSKKIADFRTEDLNVVLGVTGDDEAAKLIATITLPQMVKVLKSLSSRKRRSTPLLRSLAYNISCKEQNLDIKQCADVLYAMASLNFPDPVLLAKLCGDIQEGLKKPIERSSVIASILTSLSFLKYREPILLDSLIEWLVKNQESTRTQDIAAMFLSLASLNYMPTQFEEALMTKMAPSLTHLDFKNSQDFLSFAWSMIVLNFPLQELFNTVLSQQFIDKLISESPEKELSTANKLKLLNINAGVKLFLPTYSGAMLSRDNHNKIYDVPLVHNKEKLEIVCGMVDAIKSLVPENRLKLNQETNMGFIVDAEFYVDATGKVAENESKDGKRIAILVHDFRDMCQGSHQNYNGITALSHRLLSKAGYHVLRVPYNEFSINDKLLNRVQYLEKLIKEINKN